MTGLHLVTGYKGTAHITSADQGLFNAMSVGAGEYVFTKGRRLEAEIINKNVVRIHDGALMMNGRYITLDSGSYLDAIISDGTASAKRHDIIAIRYEMNASTGIETVSLVVETGTATFNTPMDPTIKYPDSILNGVTVHDMPLYRVVLNGTTIERVEPLYQVLAPMADIQHGFYKQNMLLNGDFQSNQRSHKTYTASTVMYTLDMWRAYKVTVQALNEGIKLTGLSSTEQGYLTQFIQLGLLKTTTYTISAMVDGKVCTFTVTPGATAKEKDFGTFKISALTISEYDNNLPEFNYYNNKLKVNICPVGTNTITIKYVDVFEGYVAYPHVKEDPATAMMRCRRYLQCGTYFSPYLWYKVDGEDKMYKCVLPYEPMVKKPTILNCNAWFFTSASKDAHVEKSYITDITATDISEIRDAFELEVHLGSAYTMNDRCSGFKLVYILSCEYKPSGD